MLAYSIEHEQWWRAARSNQRPVMALLKILEEESMAKKPIPLHLAKRFTTLSSDGTDAVVQSLRQNYFARLIWGEVRLSVEQWLATAEGQQDFRDHLSGRLDSFRAKVIPWLDSARSLSGARILEIGCGTGASTVALAEQGAKVTAIDIDEPSLRVARDRCSAHNVQCEFVQANGAAATQFLQREPYDFVIFFACLEHMTHAERMQSMHDTWRALPKGALWCVIETPNRLWFFDDHTSNLPFFNWLPDELAFAHSRFSPREPLRSSYRTRSPDAMESFLRHGRGVSFHEFDLAIADASSLDVVSSLPLWRRTRGLFGLRELARRYKRPFRLERTLASFRPDLHRGFFQPYLDLIIRKT
jgi:S-adenosylmethionine-dependent methyltransferase